MLVRTKNSFRFRYLFGLLFGILAVLFVRHFIDYLTQPGTYLAGFLPGLRPDHFLQKLTGMEFLVIDFTLLSFLLVLLFISLSFWYDKRTEREHKVMNKTENIVIPIIIGHVYQDLLFISDSLVNDKKRLRTQFKNRKTLEVFFKTLVHFQHLIDEDLSKRFDALCVETGAKNHLDYLLHSVKDSDVILGLRVVATLKDETFLPEVNHYVRSDNATLRMDAILTRLCITKQTDPEALFSSHPFLSSMDINRVLPELRKQIKDKIDLKVFLESHNTRINALAVMLLKEMGDRSFRQQIVALRSKGDDYLQAVIWDYLIEMCDEKELMGMSEHYWEESLRNKTSYLAALGRMEPNASWRNFLDLVIQKEDPSLKVLAFEALFAKDTQHFVHYLDSSDQSIERACSEVINLVN